MKKKYFELFLVPIAYIVIGILFCAFKDSVLVWICTVIGAVLAISGLVALITDCVNKKSSMYIMGDSILIGVGVLVIVLGWLIIEIIAIILGILFLCYGIYKIAFGFAIQVLPMKDKIISLIDGILYLVIGVLMIINSPSIYIAIGIILIIAGTCDILNLLFLGKALVKEDIKENKAQKAAENNVIDAEVTITDAEEQENQ